MQDSNIELSKDAPENATAAGKKNTGTCTRAEKPVKHTLFYSQNRHLGIKHLQNSRQVQV